MVQTQGWKLFEATIKKRMEAIREELIHDLPKDYEEYIRRTVERRAQLDTYDFILTDVTRHIEEARNLDKESTNG